MNAQTILRDLWLAGVELALAPDGQNLLAPAGRLTAEQRAVVLAHKPALVAMLREADAMTAELLSRAMAVCDQHGDSDKARADMRADIEATPPHLRADLLAHFQHTDQKAQP